MFNYVFYCERNTGSLAKTWAYNVVSSGTILEAYSDLVIKLKSLVGGARGWTIHAAEIYNPSFVKPLSDWIKQRAETLKSIGIAFPDGFNPTEVKAEKEEVKGELSVSTKVVKHVVLPFEIHNPVKPDPARCYDAVRAVCEGYR